MAEQSSAGDLAVEDPDLYSEAPTLREVHVNDRVRYTYCVMYALEAAVLEEQSSVTVRSIDPVARTPVTVTVTDDTVAVAPEGAVICFGSTVDPEDVARFGSLAAWSVHDDPTEVHASICEYTNAFESEASYERWAVETESVTAAFPPAAVVRLLRGLSGCLEGSP